MLYMVTLQAIFCSITWSIAMAAPIAELDKTEFLDFERNFQLRWNFNSTHIQFELRVNATGWVGIGFSDNGNMVNADIYVGWVNNGAAHITDRHGAKRNGFPPLDVKQDVVLLGGWECDGVTMIEFVRRLDACKQSKDKAITEDTTRIIYAYSDTDPIDDVLKKWNHHDVRGSKSILLLNTMMQELPENEHLHSFSILNDGSLLPNTSTHYHCIILEMPSLSSKHHVIKIEPVVEERNRRHVHHMVILRCPPALQRPEDLGRGGDCYAGTIQDYRFCITAMSGWGAGGRAMVFPEDVGFPIGLPGESPYLKLEIHYDNPHHEEIFDHSGFKFTYTSQLRQHDAGMMVTGHYLAGYNLVVPPNTDSFDVYGGCDSSCIAGALQAGGVDSIKIFALFLHTHLAGKKISLRHIRNKIELPPVVSDGAYDFHYQETREVSPPRAILKGDRLEAVCTYSSKGRKTLIEGGLSTSEEMCQTFVYYYPKVPLLICNSAPFSGPWVLNPILKVQNTRPVNTSRVYLLNRFKNLLITSPNQKAGQTLDDAINKFPWTKQTREYLSERLHHSSRRQMCIGPQPLVPFESQIPPIPNYIPYSPQKIKTICSKRSEQSMLTRNATGCAAESHWR